MTFDDWTDFDVNKAVADIVGCHTLDIEHCYKDVFISVENEDKDCLQFAVHKFDPCNDPSAAWPIICANLISVEFDAEYNADTPVAWCNASSLCGNRLDYHYYLKPLRAAMIVFLMMNGVKPEDKT